MSAAAMAFFNSPFARRAIASDDDLHVVWYSGFGVGTVRT